MVRSCEKCSHFLSEVGRCSYFTFVTSPEIRNTANRCRLYQLDPRQETVIRLPTAPVTAIYEMEEKELYKNYPYEPITPSEEEGIWWYTSPDQSYGFWTNAKMIATPPPNPHYQNHLKPYLLWFVDQNRKGQYGFYHPKKQAILFLSEYLPPEVMNRK